jgi:predicted GNAT family acetyltransferase
VSADPEIVISDAPERKRFELTVDGELAGFLIYRAREGLIALIHTEVEDGYEGRGLGGQLARFALDRARDQSLAVLPFCPFVNDWMKRHSEYSDLVPAQFRAEFEL